MVVGQCLIMKKVWILRARSWLLWTAYWINYVMRREAIFNWLKRNSIRKYNNPNARHKKNFSSCNCPQVVRVGVATGKAWERGMECRISETFLSNPMGYRDPAGSQSRLVKFGQPPGSTRKNHICNPMNYTFDWFETELREKKVRKTAGSRWCFHQDIRSQDWYEWWPSFEVTGLIIVLVLQRYFLY